MSDLLWWSGITDTTLVRDIGWTYVALAALIYALGYITREFQSAWRGEA